MDIAVIWNGNAGSAAALDPADVERRIAAATGREVTTLECSSDLDPRMRAREAVDAGARIVVAAGGDGTVSAVATELIAADSLGLHADLAVLPLGTANSFAAALDVPADLDGAIANLALPHRRVIDAAVVDGTVDGVPTRTVMILHCMVGLHAEMIGETSATAKRRWGVLAYAATALKKLATLEPFAVELRTAHDVIRCRAIQISAANLAPLKTVLAHGPSHVLGDDGRVDVTIIAAETIGEALATGVHLYRHGRDQTPATRDNVGSFSSEVVEVVATPPQAVLVDGEPFGETPVTITTLPRVLRVIAPAPAIAIGEPIDASLEGLPEIEVERR